MSKLEIQCCTILINLSAYISRDHTNSQYQITLLYLSYPFVVYGIPLTLSIRLRVAVRGSVVVSFDPCGGSVALTPEAAAYAEGSISVSAVVSLCKFK